MADVTVDIELLAGLGLPYEAGAEAALDAAASAAFATVAAIAGTPLTLLPCFDLALDELGDMMAAARQSGVEPPDLFAWYKVRCPDVVADAVAAALQGLSFVVQAAVRPPSALARWEVATDPLTVLQEQLTGAPTGIGAFTAWQVPGGGGGGARVADVETAWDLTHPDLASADVHVLVPFPTWNRSDLDHGTLSLGVVGAFTDGSVSTGIAPWADLAVSTDAFDSASAILRAARHVGRGGIVFLEISRGAGTSSAEAGRAARARTRRPDCDSADDGDGGSRRRARGQWAHRPRRRRPDGSSRSHHRLRRYRRTARRRRRQQTCRRVEAGLLHNARLADSLLRRRSAGRCARVGRRRPLED